MRPWGGLCPRQREQQVQKLEVGTRWKYSKNKKSMEMEWNEGWDTIGGEAGGEGRGPDHGGP